MQEFNTGLMMLYVEISRGGTAKLETKRRSLDMFGQYPAYLLDLRWSRAPLSRSRLLVRHGTSTNPDFVVFSMRQKR